MIKINRRKLKRKLKLTQNPFLSLATSIIYQQISTEAGNSIYKKFSKLFGRRKITPKNLSHLSTKKLRRAGLSKQKTSYLKDLAKKFLNQTVDHKSLYKMSDEDIKQHLIQVKGIGPWTADMFLIFALNRPNVLPVGDLGIQKGFQKVFGLKTLPNEKRMRTLAKPHQGQHTYLSLYLWQVQDK